MSDRPQVVIIGAGIVGLATADALGRRGKRVLVLEKEADIARHQTGRNSGVIHSGLYYRPGSLKARLATAGATSMVEFARHHDIAVDVCGKLVVATKEDQLARLADLERRGRLNGVPCRLVGAVEVHELEPAVAGLAGLRVDTTGVVDYRAVAGTLRRLVTDRGGEVRTDRRVVKITSRPDAVVIETEAEEIRADALVNCAGLHSDRVAGLAGLRAEVRIVPFRGEYAELSGAAADLVRGLVYPVPDPALPFLGVHLTRALDGTVHAGPNAVLALAREGYRWSTIDPADLAETLAWPGLWRLAGRYGALGATELARSVSRRRFLGDLRRLVPALQEDDLVSAPAGVRAQAVRRDGTLVDDFLITRADRQVHVLNAPSPAATAALEIGRHIADQLPDGADQLGDSRHVPR